MLLLPLALLCAPSATQSPGEFLTGGAGCPGVTADSGPVLYGVLPGGNWHLGESSLTFTHSGGDWSLAAGGEYLQPSSAANAVASGDNEVVGPFALPFVFTYPGGDGSTSSIEVNSNGRVYLEAGTNPFDKGFTAAGVLPDFLNATPSICALGVNLNPQYQGLIFFETRTVGADEVAVVTWDSVPAQNGGSLNSFQCQLWSTGEVVLSYGTIGGTATFTDALVGISAGGGAADPGPSSVVLPPALYLADDAGPVIGSSVRIGVRGVPLTATSAFLGIHIPGAPPSQPSSNFAVAPGCGGQIAPDYSIRVMSLQAPVAEVSLPWAYDPALVGVPMECQAFLFDPAEASGLALVSDRGVLMLGEPYDLVFVAEGANSYYGSPGSQGSSLPGFFRLESGPSATHPEIVRLQVELIGGVQYFDTVGNAGVAGQGHFADGNGTGPGCANAYYGSDRTTGLIYGGPLQGAGCEGAGTTGWVGTSPVQASPTRYRGLTFDFDGFGAGETFRFDCDTDRNSGVGDFSAGTLPLQITVTFSDGSTLSSIVQPISTQRAEGVLIP